MINRLAAALLLACLPPALPACPDGQDFDAVDKRLKQRGMAQHHSYLSHDGDTLVFYVDARDGSGRWMVVQVLVTGCAWVVDVGERHVRGMGGSI